jgi:hypothetical protein
VVVPAALPEHLRIALESPAPRVREGAVLELVAILKGPDAPAALRARLTLEEAQSRDVPQIAELARGALGSEADKSVDVQTPADSVAGTPEAPAVMATQIDAPIPSPVMIRNTPPPRASGATAPRVQPQAARTLPALTAPAGAPCGLLVAAYLFATAIGTLVASVSAKESFIATTTRLAQIEFAILISAPVLVAWFLVMYLAGHTRVSRTTTAVIVLVASLLSGLSGFAVDIGSPHAELVVANVWFALLLATGVGLAARSRAALLVALTSGVILGAIAALVLPSSWLAGYSITSLFKLNIVLNLAVVLVPAFWLARAGWGDRRAQRDGPPLRPRTRSKGVGSVSG